MKKNDFIRRFYLLAAIALVSCDQSSKSVILGTTSPSAPTAFQGAISAVDTGTGLQIQVSWGAVPSSATQIRVMAYNPSNGSLTPLATLPATAGFYTHTPLTSGSQYSYVVQALDSTGNPDGNQKIVTALAYAGINQSSGGVATAPTAATLFFAAPGAQTSGANLYCRTNYTPDALVGTATATQTSAALTGLLSGTNYICHVQAVSSLTSLADTNTQTFSFQTISVGFTQSSPAYQGVILVQAYGDSAGAPTASSATFANPPITSPVTTPTSRQVNITWKNFAVTFPSLAAYRVVRVVSGGALAMNTTAVCTSTTLTACQVCTNTSTSNSLNTIYSRTCSDTALSDPSVAPLSYDYAISLIVNNATNPQMAEEMAAVDTPFRITVHVPPQNMVLVHRDSANYQMCNLLGSTSDPLNHQRCAFGTPTNPATGATTFSSQASGLNPLPSNCSASTCYYDFGYNLFVDRYNAGCNWTPGGTGGQCGAGGTVGDCNGSGTPSSIIGANGNVYYDSTNGICYVKQSNAWANIANATSSGQALAYTNAPSRVYQKPPIVNITNQAAWNVCQAVVNAPDGSSFYGQKRLMRRREQVVAAPFTTIQGEPGALTSAAVTVLQKNGTTHPAGQVCNQNDANGVTQTGVFNSQTELAQTATSFQFMIGSDYTAQCTSRFGAQDMTGNVYEWVSDTLSTCTTSLHTCTGGASVIGDLGNKDLLNYNFDGVTGPGGTAAGQTSPNYTYTMTFNAGSYNATNINFPMGLPFVGNDRGNASTYNTTAFPGSMLYNEGITIATDTSASPVARQMFVGSSFANSAFDYWSFSTGTLSGLVRSDTGFRCALPAQ